MSTSRHDEPRGEDARGDWLYLLGRIAWRLVQMALVTAGVMTVIWLVNPGRGGEGKQKAYIAAMKSDLRNLVTAQESYFADYHAYAPSLEALGPSYFRTSVGVTIVIDGGAAGGFAATATHTQTPYRCGIFIEAGAPITPAPVLSWSANPGERHDLLRAGDSVWIERWPGHEELFRIGGRDMVLGSTGTLLRKHAYPSLELFVRDRGQPLRNILWREHGGPWHTLGAIVVGSESVPPVAAAEVAQHRMAPPWPGAQEGVPLCWKG